MANFKGKNSINSVGELSRQRAKYNTQAFSSNGGVGPKQVLDFNFAERTNYGRVDRQHNPVYPIKDYIVPIMSSDNSISTNLVMNFVADQFRDLETHFVKACRSNLIPTDDPILSVLTAKKGYMDPVQDYKNYRDSIMRTFIEDFIIENNFKVNNINDFMFYLIEFMKKMTDVFPITFSGYQRSSQGSIFSSGLAIDIAGIPFDDDEMKENLLFRSPAYNYYLNLTKQYGFSVNKRNPGVLISDVASPVTTVYRQKYNLSTVNLIFSQQFKKTLYDDLQYLLDTIADNYNNYISKKPFERNFHTTWSLKTVTVIKDKKIFDINNINNKLYNNIIKLYITIRNIEERYPYSENEIAIIEKNALKIHKNRSEQKMLDFIDKQFKNKYNQQEGFLTYHLKKNRKRLDKE